MKPKAHFAAPQLAVTNLPALSSNANFFYVVMDRDRLMNDAMRRDLELTTQDEIAFVALHILPPAKKRFDGILVACIA